MSCTSPFLHSSLLRQATYQLHPSSQSALPRLTPTFTMDRPSRAHANPLDRLVQIQVIHRHGARAPGEALTFPSLCNSQAFRPFLTFTPRLPPVTLKPLKKNLFNPSHSNSCYAGQLTPLGAAQMFALGARLRQRYHDLLPTHFDPDLVRLRSTAITRTIESAVACLSGMYPTGGDVEVEVKERVDDYMVPFKQRCCRLSDMQRTVREGSRLPSGMQHAITDALGTAGGDGSSIIALRDIAVAMQGNGLRAHEWAHEAERLGNALILRMNPQETWGLAIGKVS